MLGRLEVGTSTRGDTQLLKWAHTFSPTTTFGVEGTGAYGAGLARFLIDAGCEVIEINRPDRRARRGHGKSDPIDAEAERDRCSPVVRSASPSVTTTGSA
jgi:transposase